MVENPYRGKRGSRWLSSAGLVLGGPGSFAENREDPGSRLSMVANFAKRRNMNGGWTPGLDGSINYLSPIALIYPIVCLYFLPSALIQSAVCRTSKAELQETVGDLLKKMIKFGSVALADP